MSEPTTTRATVPKPQKKRPEAVAATSTDDSKAANEPLIDIPVPKKKKERHVKTEADIAAKQERKRLRKETELAKRIAKQHNKKIGARITAATPASSTAKATPTATPTTTTQKIPKWKQFLKNTSDIDNAEALKDTSYKVKGDDGSGDESDSDSEEEKKTDTKITTTTINNNKRKAEQAAESTSKIKKGKQEDAALATLDTTSPGLAYLVEWKRTRDTWKFQKLRQVWLINNMYNDKEIPDSHWEIFLEYIRDLKGAARTAAIQEAQKIVDAPEEEEAEEDKELTSEETTGEDGDKEMKDADSVTPGEEAMMSEEEKAEAAAARDAKAEVKRAAEVKSSRALEVLRLLA
ncbi:hypothetical protein BGZ93_008623 [Podila epicladia]|nr:hypothetical protein BGZ93_008623 [Podila epicladia]KAG0092034.1 hypothetical protein BGZ92_011043 [Podila epicladia]